MIPIPGGVRIWIATGHADMRKGMPGLSLLVQEHFKRDPFAGDVFIFRGRGASLIKCLWHGAWAVALRQAAGSGAFHLAGGVGRGHFPVRIAGLLPLGGRGLAQPPTDLAPQVGRLKN
jgi:transposase